MSYLLRQDLSAETLREVDSPQGAVVFVKLVVSKTKQFYHRLVVCLASVDNW